MGRPHTSSKFIRGDTNDDRVVMTSTLGWAEDAVAKMYMQQLLRRIRYILTTHNWRVFHLQEFYPRSARLYGLNVNKGQEVKVRFRLPGNKNTFFPFQEIMCTLLHEVVHCQFSRHDKKFWDCYRVVVLECEELDVRFAASENPSIRGSLPSFRNHEMDPQHSSAAQPAAQDRLNENGELTTQLDLSIPDAFHGYHVFRPAAGASQTASGQTTASDHAGGGAKTVIHLQVPRFMSTRRLCDGASTPDGSTNSNASAEAPSANTLLRSILGNRAPNARTEETNSAPVNANPEKGKRRKTVGKGHVLSGVSMYQRRKNMKQQSLVENQSPEEAAERRREVAAQAVARRLDSITLEGIRLLSDGSKSAASGAGRGSLESDCPRKTLLEYFKENVARHSQCLDPCDDDVIEEGQTCTSEQPNGYNGNDDDDDVDCCSCDVDALRSAGEPPVIPSKCEVVKAENEDVVVDMKGDAAAVSATTKRSRADLESEKADILLVSQHTCKACTFLNDKDVRECKMCGNSLHEPTLPVMPGNTISNPIDVDDDED